MEPRDESQPWPSGKAPVPAWTKTMAGGTYTIKRIDGDRFGIWREVEELGTFRLTAGSGDELRPSFPDDLSLEARRVVEEFVTTYDSTREGAAQR